MIYLSIGLFLIVVAGLLFLIKSYQDQIDDIRNRKD